MKAFHAVALFALAGCGSTGGMTSLPSPVSAMRPEDRVLLGDFSRVHAIAATFDRVYVAYPTALGIWRPNQQRWEVPRTPPAIQEFQQVRAAAVDPLDQSVWLATETGWLHYRLESDRWDRGTLPGRVTALAVNPLDPARGIWFRTTTGWVVQPSIGPAVPAAPPAGLRMTPTINDAMADLPQLRTLASTILVGPRMQAGQFTAAAPAASNGGWFLGTTNRGLLYLDRTAARAEPLGLGIPGEVVGATIAVGSGVWVATDATYDQPAALTFVDEQLGSSHAITGALAQGLPFDAARRLLAGDRVVWVATDRGAVRVSLDNERVEHFDEGRGLPDNRVIALVQWQASVVAGTMHGLARIGASGEFTRIAPELNEPAASLASRGDTLWVGTTRGLFALLAGTDELRMPEGFRQLVEGRTTVLGVGYRADTLVAMTPERIVWRDPVTGAWTPGPMLATQLGTLTTFHADEYGIWVGGSRGAALIDPVSGVLRLLTAPGDLPDQVTSIANTGRYLWIGTRSGLVRQRLN